MTSFIRKHYTWLLIVLFCCIGLIVRFLYFPSNIYFGFDQARDAYAVLDILKGHLKIIGPTTSTPGFFHGVLYYYIFAPFYFLAKGSPIGVGGFLRVTNVLGIVIIFFISRNLFNKKIGLIAAWLFAISFEQTQYALFLNHPSLAVISILIFYLGLSQLFFQNKKIGFLITMIGLGLSIQFELVLLYLLGVLLVLGMYFHKSFLLLNKKAIIYGLIALTILLSSFIAAEIKFRLINTHNIKAVTGTSGTNFFSTIPRNIALISNRAVHDNLFAGDQFLNLVTLTLTAVLVYLFVKSRNFRSKLFFLAIWFCGGFVMYLHDTSASPLYYYSVGASSSLLIFVSLLISKLLSNRRSYIIGWVVLIAITLSNLQLIRTQNPKGPLPTINVQTKMLLLDEKKVLDYIYQKASSQPFAVNALTMPYNVNTTWSYLFSWYGQQRYGYKPVWGGDAAEGFPGSLIVNKSRSTLPELKFLIIEPTRGIAPWIIDDFMRQENYFTKVNIEKQIGGFIVQERKSF